MAIPLIGIFHVVCVQEGLIINTYCYAGLRREQFVVCTRSVARGHVGEGKG
jgi:hypothetical protein